MARIPSLVFEFMMLLVLFGRYEKTFPETVRRKKTVKTGVIGA